MNKNYKKYIFQNTLLRNIFHSYIFIKCHKRLPCKNSNTFSDLIHNVKCRGSKNVLRQFVADKEFVKIFVKAKLSDEYNVPTLKILRTKDEALRFLNNPNYHDYVFKPTHMSGECEFVYKNTTPTKEQIQKGINWFDVNYTDLTGEAVYSRLEPKIIVEPIINFDGGSAPKDYKIFCYNGIPQMIQVDVGRFNDHKRNLYTLDWQKLPFTLSKQEAEEISKPINLDKMLSIAAKLSENFGFIRVDLYTSDDQVLVGELTNTPENGFGTFTPAAKDIEVGMIFADPDKTISELL